MVEELERYKCIVLLGIFIILASGWVELKASAKGLLDLTRQVEEITHGTDPKAVLESLQKFIASHATCDAQTLALATRNIGLKYHVLGNNADAYKYWEMAATKYPQTQAGQESAAILAQENSNEHNINLLKSTFLTARNEKSARFLATRLVVTYGKVKSYEKADAVYNNYLYRFGAKNKKELMFQVIVAAAASGKKKIAYDMMHKYVKDYPYLKSDSMILMQLGFLAKGAGNNKEALRFLDQASLQGKLSGKYLILALEGKAEALRLLDDRSYAKATLMRAKKEALRQRDREESKRIDRMLKSSYFTEDSAKDGKVSKDYHWLTLTMCLLTIVVVGFRVSRLLKGTER